VSLDNRTADRQAHSHSIRLGRVERVEDPVGIAKPIAAIAHFDLDSSVILMPRHDAQASHVDVDVLHRFDAVADEVQDDLLHLHVIGDCRGKIRIEVEVKLDVGRCQPVTEKITHFADHRIQIDRVRFAFGLAEQRPDAADHLRCRVGVSDDLLGYPAGMTEVGRVGVEPSLECAGVGHDSLEWLVEFVRNGHRQLGQTGGAQGAREPLVRQTQGFLGADLVVNIEVDTIPTQDRTVFVAQRFEARIDPAIFAVLPAKPAFVLERFSTSKRLLEDGLDGRLVVGMEQLHMRGELPCTSRFFLGGVYPCPVDEPFVEIVGQSRRRHQPDHGGNRIDQQPEFPLALPQRRFGLAPVVYVLGMAIPADDSTSLIARGNTSIAKPSIGAIAPAQALFRDHRFARL